MARIATLLGKDVKSGSWSSLGVAEGNGIEKLVALRNSITDAGGTLKKGKSEVRLSEIRILASGTPGGEFKGRRKFK